MLPTIATMSAATTATARSSANSLTRRRKRPRITAANAATANTHATLSAEDQAHIWHAFEADIPATTPADCPLPIAPPEPAARDICDACSYMVATTEDGFQACTNPDCAIIYTDILNHAAEWRYFADGDNQQSDPNRCGLPIDPMFAESSTALKVACRSGTKMNYEMRKLRRYVEWQAMPYSEKSQYDDFQYITAMANRCGIHKKLIDDSFHFYKKLFDYKISYRGENRDSLIASSIYLSCRANQNPRTAKEIAAMFQLNATAAARGCKNALHIINVMELEIDVDDKTAYCDSRPSLFVDRFCCQVGMPPDLTLLAEFICLKMEHYNVLTENTPQAICAGVISFVAATFGITTVTKRAINAAINISDVTINKCHKKIAALRAEFIPASFVERFGLVPTTASKN